MTAAAGLAEVAFTVIVGDDFDWDYLTQVRCKAWLGPLELVPFGIMLPHGARCIIRETQVDEKPGSAGMLLIHICIEMLRPLPAPIMVKPPRFRPRVKPSAEL